jgi:hypothetical protein
MCRSRRYISNNTEMQYYFVGNKIELTFVAFLDFFEQKNFLRSYQELSPSILGVIWR